MKCQECENFLEGYVDGELEARDRDAVGAHLAACALCADAHQALVSEASLYASYERGVEAAAPRLWGGVEARIRAEKTVGDVGLLQRVSAWFAPLLTAPRFSPALTAALVLVAVLLTVGVMKLTGSREQPQQPTLATNVPQYDPNRVAATSPTMQPAATSTPAAVVAPSAAPGASPEQKSPQPENRKSPSDEQRRRANELPGGGGRVEQAVNATPTPGRDSKATPDQLVREAEQRYIAAIRMLERDVKSRRSLLDPQTAARFDETLAAIDRSIGETRRTVRKHGSDPVAVQYMLSAYAKKVEVLREMAHAER
ncbi:MAG: zf-HC2 domain-containing protein [Acidobacteria bacterium]|nr:zf-HC2 domain-containing protein [Acidobacteriota bacterium]MCA1642886.1 zf-HC2 domain-containing protein [Acidobacteriota bacterium]